MPQPVLTPMTISAALRYGMQRLANSESARLDAEVLLCHVLECSRAQLMSRAEQRLGDRSETRFLDLIATRELGKPIAYLIGRREFWSLPIAVSEQTLIPRPDTECLVEHALSLIQKHGYRRILDLGTGSGAIALALASECRHCQVFATDISPEAIAVTEQNAKRLGIHNLQALIGDWFEPLGSLCFDMIVSNPPYLAANDEHLTDGDLRFEPRSALVSGVNGLEALQTIVQNAPSHLSESGSLLVEHGYRQASCVNRLFAERGFRQIVTRKDFGNNDRVTAGYWQL